MRVGSRRVTWIAVALAVSLVSIAGLSPALEPDAVHAQTLDEDPFRTGYLSLGQLTFEESACCLVLSGNTVAVGLGEAVELLDISRRGTPRSVGRFELESAPTALVGLPDRLFVAQVSGDLSIYDIGRPAAPRLLGRLPGPLAGVTDMHAEPGLLLVAHGMAISAYDVSRPDEPHWRSSLTLAEGARRIASSGDLIVAATGNSGMEIVDRSEPDALRSLGTYTVTGSVLTVGLIGSQAYLTEREYLRFPTSVDGWDRPMPPVPMANRIHRVDLEMPLRPRADWVHDANDHGLQGLPELAVGPSWMHVAGLAYSPGANVWRLIAYDLGVAEPTQAASLSRGYGGFGGHNAHPIAIESDGDLIVVLEQVRNSDESGSTLSILQAPTFMMRRVWLPALGSF